MQTDPNELLKKFREDLFEKTFSGRNPQLGKMINCRVCQTRHRSNKICQANYVQEAPHTRKGIYGADSFKRRRLHPHHNQRALQLIERTRLLFPLYSDLEPENALKAARAQAGRELRQERRKRNDQKRDVQHISRHINRGLLDGTGT